MAVKLIFFAGSARKDSLNKKLAKAASEKAKELGAEVTYIDLADYKAPLFCEDYESENSMPQSIKDLKKLFIEHDGFLIACPEYNSSFTPLLKNTLDWMSRGDENCFQGKVSAIMAATNIAMHGTFVIPKQFSLGSAGKAFDDNGTLKDDNPMFNACVEQFVETAEKLKR